jgi:hypothetical protein
MLTTGVVSVRTVIELNMKHYRALLKSETDPVKRRTVANLLAEEEAKFAKLMQQAADGSQR